MIFTTGDIISVFYQYVLRTCILANSPAEWKIKLAEVFDKTFENQDILDRTKLLENLFDNLENAKLISELMTQHSLTEK